MFFTTYANDYVHSQLAKDINSVRGRHVWARYIEHKDYDNQHVLCDVDVTQVWQLLYVLRVSHGQVPPTCVTAIINQYR